MLMQMFAMITSTNISTHHAMKAPTRKAII